MITGPEPGLTRDAVAVRLTDADGTVIELVDTAGMRRRARVEQALEKMSVSASIEALKMAEVVVLAVDAHRGAARAGSADRPAGRARGAGLRAGADQMGCWWPTATPRGAGVSDRLETSLAQMKGIAVVTLSAMTGQGLDKLLPAVRAAHAVWNKRIATGALNRWFEAALERHQPPLVSGRRLKLRYMTQAKARPPTFIVFGTRAEQTPEDYQRYLVNGLRESFDLPGTPIRLQFRGTENPYAPE